MQRMGQVIGIRPEAMPEYRRLHTDVETHWPEVAAAARASHIHNYTIFWHGSLLFAAFEYHGDDYAADMATLSANPAVQAYWALVEPLQVPLDSRQPGEHWATMEEVYHAD
jgi:L-rhamnose mutarotase